MASSLSFSKKERKRKSQKSVLHNFFQTREGPQPGTYQKVKSLQYSMVKKRSMQGRYSGTVALTYFFISLHVAWLFYITFN
jgi:hypothetical protein